MAEPDPSKQAPVNGRPAGEPIVDPDRDLVTRCQKSQPAAFDELVRRYQDRVFNIAFRMLREREVAEEIAQDVFVSVYQHIEGFQGNSKFSTWLFRVVANHCHNKSKYLRRRKHKQQDSLDAPIEGEDGDLKRELPDDPGRSPEELATRRKMNEAIQEAISHLDEDHRVIVLLRDVEDMSYEEIGEVLGLPEGTVKSRLHRARNELRARLSRMGEG
jgi:RNA polymerase sigma-70 factor (ECF subfamily)